MNINEMQAGAHLDHLVAARVMVWGFSSDDIARGLEGGFTDATGEVVRLASEWSPSTNIAHAWEVVDRLRLCLIPVEDGLWMAGIPDDMGYWSKHGIADGHVNHCAAAETPALAICRAALKAVGAK
jgi:hypothetical protein